MSAFIEIDEEQAIILLAYAAAALSYLAYRESTSANWYAKRANWETEEIGRKLAAHRDAVEDQEDDGDG